MSRGSVPRRLVGVVGVVAALICAVAFATEPDRRSHGRSTAGGSERSRGLPLEANGHRNAGPKREGESNVGNRAALDPSYAAPVCSTELSTDLDVRLARGTPTAEARGGTGCSVLVVAALESAEYFTGHQFLARLSALTGAPADYFDAVVATPTLAGLLPYDMVIAFTDNFWDDTYGTGDVLADYVEAGGRVILGNYNHHTEGAASWLDGRIMEDYNPASIDDSRWSADYSGDGTDCILAGVPTFHTLPYDHIESLVGSAGSDGTYDDGSTLAAFRLDRSVYYVSGHMGGWLSGSDPPSTDAWAQLTANICSCPPEPITGACCNPFDGTCTDSVLAASCQPPLLFNAGATCQDLDPVCGSPGACCDDASGGCTVELARNCDGRFAAGEPCDGDLFVPACGDTREYNILYAPSADDSPRFREDLAQLLASDVDYFDARSATPSLALLQQYRTVLTWVENFYDDSVRMGDVLADYVESGGQVVLGLWSAPGANNGAFLEGRLMEEYNPVTIFGLDWGGTSYSGDGDDCLHDGVESYSPRIYDQIVDLAPAAFVGGTYLNRDGVSFPSVVYRHDREVVYVSGFDGGFGGAGDWAQLIANISTCPTVDRVGACCDAATGSCSDDVVATDCLPPLTWTEGTACADLSPLCGNPGACCDDTSAACSDTIEVACTGRFRAEESCDAPTFVPECGLYEPCSQTLVLRDDFGDGWSGGQLDVYVGGFPVLTGVTLADGAGPESVTFPAQAGELIQTFWTGSLSQFFDRESSYCIAGLDGTTLTCDGLDETVPTGVLAFASCQALECGNGLCQRGGGENCASCFADCGECGCVFQPSTGSSGFLSDQDCQACPDGVQVLADNFRLLTETQMVSVRFPGAYSPEGITSEPDRFTVVFREDADGLPGAELASFGPLAGIRSPLGADGYEYELALDTTLPAGSYWLEVYNDTSDTSENWSWFEGGVDVRYGVQGLAFSLELPEQWDVNASLDLAFHLVCIPEVRLTLDKSGDEVQVSWVIRPDVSYDVLYRQSGESQWTRVQGVTSPWTHPGALNDGVDYHYEVEAFAAGQ